ncbi:DHA2 family efflux MFS transporter permease subunit [Novosphingobium sp. G106]|uniref:DHA2 family efflux MFS transporter permease subunit n=1 Tax=Novosphingobium sp. G106 TaxID=2849500 RepID=UPI001C2D0276|nr:DHA2 family efflux MFS transporter permease subunit [Novosphingobium sp. G106]MBV1690632.1 DHA2 family efflux MFS transporter permease subunit [Novosphingobium sp. G106]
MSQAYPQPGQRRLIVIFSMASAIMNQIDTTIANVALPHMQGTTSASREQIAWVLTSYIIALAIATPLTGWLAGRFGRRRLMLWSIVGFTAASLLCGIASNLDELVLFRLLQGAAGSALVPMSQATLLDIHPPEEHGKAMAVFGLAAIMGPLAGPVLGGWLTENFSWHWVFLINLPIGLFAFIGLSAVMPDAHDEEKRRFDLLGFALLAVAIGSFQLMMDRGQLQDWFQSTEIWIEATISGLALFLFIVHVLTAEHPFIRLAIFADRNYVISTLIGFFLGIMIYGVLSLLPPMLSALYGYPIITIGLVSAPRGLGTFVATLVMGRIINRIDARMLVFVGLIVSSLSALLLSRMSLDADEWLVIASGVINGMGSSMIFVPLAAIAFTTLPRQLRNEGAAFGTLTRYLGSAVGISVLQTLTYRNEAIVQSRLTEGVRPDNPAVSLGLPNADFSLPDTLGALSGEIVRQATMVSYVDAFWMLFLVGALASPLAFLMQTKKAKA